MPYVGKITAGGQTAPVSHTLIGTCSTAANVASKVVTCTNFDTAAASIADGTSINVYFQYGNTATTPTLAVGSASAVGVVAPDGSSAPTWEAGIIPFVWHSNNWWIVNVDSAISDSTINSICV